MEQAEGGVEAHLGGGRARALARQVPAARVDVDSAGRTVTVAHTHTHAHTLTPPPSAENVAERCVGSHQQ